MTTWVVKASQRRKHSDKAWTRCDMLKVNNNKDKVQEGLDGVWNRRAFPK